MKLLLPYGAGTSLRVRTLAGSYEGIVVCSKVESRMLPYFAHGDRAYSDFYSRMHEASSQMRYMTDRSMSSRSYSDIPPALPMPGLHRQDVPVVLQLQTDDGIEDIAYEHIVSVRVIHAETPS